MGSVMAFMAFIPFIMLMLAGLFLYREFTKNALHQNRGTLTYQLRHYMAIASGLSHQELMDIISKRLDDHDRRLINEVLDIICAELFKFQPSKKTYRQRLISEYQQGELVCGPR